MRIEIDQSGRIEETNRDTVLAFVNGKKFSVRIKARTKRRLKVVEYDELEKFAIKKSR